MAAFPARLGVVAGGGKIPALLLRFCDAHEIQTFVIGFENQTDLELLKGREHVMTRLGAAGQIVKILKNQNINDLVMIGSIKRPGIADMRPDLYTFGFFAKLGFRALGDDGLLQAIHGQLSHEGFIIHGIHEIMPELLMPEGLIGSVGINAKKLDDIAIGYAASKELGRKDIGQSVVVKDGKIIGTEDSKGTNDLIRRCAGGILVKTCKPQQNRKLDLPAIGVDTIKLCAELGYEGVAVEAGAALLVDRDEAIEVANKSGLFLIGVSL